MDLGQNTTNNNLREYVPLKKVWEANAIGSPKVLAQAQSYLKNLPALVGTGSFTTIILDLQTSEVKGFIENFREIFGIDYQEDMKIIGFVPLIYPNHSTFMAEHFATYLTRIPRPLKQSSHKQLTLKQL